MVGSVGVEPTQEFANTATSPTTSGRFNFRRITYLMNQVYASYQFLHFIIIKYHNKPNKKINNTTIKLIK